MQTLAVTVAYLIYDMICSQFDKRSKSNVDNTIHHLVSIVGIGAGLFYQKVTLFFFPQFLWLVVFLVFFVLMGFSLKIVQCGTEMVTALFITEISSPFLHLREFLKELGYKDTDVNLAADVSFSTFASIT